MSHFGGGGSRSATLLTTHGDDRNVNVKTRALNIDVTTRGESAIEDEYRDEEQWR